MLGLTTMFGIHALRVVFARPHREPEQTLNDPVDCPYISLLVAAKRGSGDWQLVRDAV